MPKNVEEYMRWKHGKVPIDHSEDGEYRRASGDILPGSLGEKCRRILEISRWSPEYRQSIESAKKFCTKPE